MELGRGLLLLLAGVLLSLSVALVLPFLDYFLLAVLLAYLLSPVADRLESLTTPRIAAAGTTLGATLVILVPLIVVVRVAASEAADLYERFRRGELTFEVFESYIRQVAGVRVDLGGSLQSAAEGVGTSEFGSLLGALGTATHALVGVGLTIFLLFYFLKDGDGFVRWLRRTSPLPADVQDDLFDEIDGIMRAVLMGHVLVAIVQGLIAGLGFLVLDIPNTPLWTAVMVVLALLPIVGSFLVWGPAVVYLLAGGRPLAGGFLFVYGTIVVGVSDDYLRPVVVDRYAHLNPSVIILGILGGIYVFGFMGIFFGPVIIGALRATVEVFAEEYGATAR